MPGSELTECNVELTLFHLTAVDCGTLTNPANGQVSHPSGTTFGQTAKYDGHIGYNLVGDGTRTCQAKGLWSGSAPTCQGVLQGCSKLFQGGVAKVKITYVVSRMVWGACSPREILLN